MCDRVRSSQQSRSNPDGKSACVATAEIAWIRFFARSSNASMWRMTARPTVGAPGTRIEWFAGLGIGSVLPRVSSNLLSGMMEALASEPFNGKADLPEIASRLQMEIDDLFPVAETLQMMRFAEVEGGDIRLTEAGSAFANAGVDERKEIFARQLLCYVPLAAHVHQILDERASHVAPMSRFSDELEDYMAPQAAEQTLRAIISGVATRKSLHMTMRSRRSVWRTRVAIDHHPPSSRLEVAVQHACTRTRDRLPDAVAARIEAGCLGAEVVGPFACCYFRRYTAAR